MRSLARPLVAYFLLACAVSWIAVSPLVAAWLGWLPPIAPAWHWVGALGPVTAAFTVTAATQGRDGVRELWGRMTRWRVGMGWWLLATLSPLVLFVLGAALLRLSGRPWPDVTRLQTPLANPGWLLNLVAVSVAYGVGEEPGWRGFVLPRLEARRSALGATLILTLLWALWHTPYFTYRSHIAGIAGYAGFFACLLAGAIWLTFLYNSSGGSVLMVILWHAVWNVLNVAGAALSNDLVAVSNVLVIPLALVALLVGGPRQLSLSVTHVIAPRSLVRRSQGAVTL